MTNMVAFFHQNDVFGAEGGGIERYIATLLTREKNRTALVSPEISGPSASHFAVRLLGVRKAPRWLSYSFGVLAQARAIKSFLRESRCGVLEFSRPEYALFAWLFPGKRVFTIHGTGPAHNDRMRHLIHYVSCYALPLVADRVQIVGRDASGLPALVRGALKSRLTHIDAWYDDRFKPSAMPSLADGPLKVFYAGRLTSQKNPQLLFSLIRRAAALEGKPFEFHYFGADYERFVEAGVAQWVVDHGFLQPDGLAKAIGACHVGLMCSGFGEGSPFIVVEALACGRPYVLPPLPTLLKTYTGFPGVSFAERYDEDAFLDALFATRGDIMAGRATPETIALRVADRSQSRAASALLDALEVLQA